ncbi:type III pantothenate kinase [Massilia psychrophila]|uniref:Type III pantothenate kinase n=1 Tax=Massilia psychrophila TaxID=1603353 RepID=A0A2G8T318_9BURK|nr:type III pantothenate kinase [Massilia psychrophila]PIL40078.1 type III pantothenate kinase [Massilia psychrophila]GGE69949.1 type III pantothenate kinase [Massilia psychrophila]
MLLLIDAGNTRIKWALAADDVPLGQWSDSGAVTHAELNYLPASWRHAGVTRAIVSNVAGAKVRDQLQLMIPAVDVTWFASVFEMAGVRNGYRNPGQLGCDRFAAAIGARALEPDRALVVATCGTATTIDALNLKGDFIGGMILPGLGLMAASLARNTAQLPMIVASGATAAGFADNTDDAILSGCLSAQAGAIERACGLLGPSLCVLSGGAARYIAQALSTPYRMIDNIVLVGLHAAAVK